MTERCWTGEPLVRGRLCLRQGDIVTAINDRAVHSLKEYADVLRALAPGDAVRIRFLRDGAPHTVDTRVVER